MIRGNFIVIEGIDGSGTTTQAVEIKKKLSDLGLPAHVTAEPSTGPIGAMIRQILTGRLVTRLPSGITQPRWATMALLFGADRQDHLESEIEPNLRDGVTVICDRYVYSSVLYQSVSAKDDSVSSWISEVNRYARKPDLVLNLNVDPKEAAYRCEERDHGEEIFETPEMQRMLAEKYKGLTSIFPDVNIANVDGNQSIEDVTADCWKHVEELRAKGAPE